MTESDRLAICLRLREAGESLGRLFENVACGSTPLVCLEETSTLADLACELQSAFMRLAKQPGELPFVGANVAVGVEVDDKGAQRAMAVEQNARADRLEAESAA